MNRSALVVISVAAVGTGCGDRTLPVGLGEGPAEVASSATLCSPSLANSIRAEIATLFPKTQSLGSALGDLGGPALRECQECGREQEQCRACGGASG